MPTVTRLSTEDAPPRERVGYWSDLVWRSFGRLRSDTYGDADFSGQISLLDLGEVRLCRLQAARHRVVRTAAVGGSDPGFLKMVIQRRGCSLFEQGGRTARLKPGDWSLYDTTRSYIVSAPNPVDLHILLLPRWGILRGRRDLEQMLVHRLRGRTGMAKLAALAIGRALESAVAGDTIGPGTGEEIVELLHLALLEQSGARLPRLGRELMRARIKQYVNDRLGDPELSLDAVAQALRCSKRALHMAFEVEGRTLRDYIWDSRLENARCALERAAAADAGAARGAISRIAFASGFNSAAHFSRAFRGRYGVSPRAWHEGSRSSLNSEGEPR
jgi:AraC-like DNA-binding protein